MLNWRALAIVIGSVVHVCLAAEVQPSDSKDNQNKAMDEATQAMTGDGGTNEFPRWCSYDRWSFQAGVAFITGSTIDEISLLDTEMAEGDARGEIYLMQVSYKLANYNPEKYAKYVDIDVELPLVLGVVNERKGDPFMQYNIGVTLRWKRFPWNRYVYTNFETGCGFTYSGRVLETERQRHPDRERSHVEFYWPIQLTVAHPKHREHQLVLFIHHHSGGTLFHTGGANSLGFGYRYVPIERHP